MKSHCQTGVPVALQFISPSSRLPRTVPFILKRIRRKSVWISETGSNGFETLHVCIRVSATLIRRHLPTKGRRQVSRLAVLPSDHRTPSRSAGYDGETGTYRLAGAEQRLSLVTIEAESGGGCKPLEHPSRAFKYSGDFRIIQVTALRKVCGLAPNESKK